MDAAHGHLKRCSKCEIPKAPTEFYSKPGKPGVLRAECKACHGRVAERGRVTYERSAQGQAARARYSRSQHRRDYAKTYRQQPGVRETERERDRSRDRTAYRRQYRQTPTGKESFRRAAAKAHRLNPARSRAHHAVAQALKRGRLIRPSLCDKCGRSRWRIEAHHHLGYAPAHWLDVQWLCQRCHLQLHKLLD